MYLKIKDVAFYFEYIGKPNIYYFNTLDYQIYNPEERQELLNSDLFEVDDFIVIPQKNQIEIAKQFLIKQNNRSLARNDKFDGQKFHCYIEENYLVPDWRYFEKEELKKFAAAWCEENNIIFTR